MWQVWGRREMHTGFWWEPEGNGPHRRTRFKQLILKWVLIRWETGLNQSGSGKDRWWVVVSVVMKLLVR
jgi:hypothetical protein